MYDKTRDGESLTELLVGEMKYTNKEPTFSDGLKELLGYLKYARQDPDVQEYLQHTESDLRGVLIVDAVEFDQPTNTDISVLDTDMLRGDPELPD